jgi:hypothetical protein
LHRVFADYVACHQKIKFVKSVEKEPQSIGKNAFRKEYVDAVANWLMLVRSCVRLVNLKRKVGDKSEQKSVGYKDYVRIAENLHELGGAENAG